MKGRFIPAAVLLVLTQPLHAGWIRGYGKDSLNEGGYSVRQTVDGGYIIAGRASDTVDCDLYLIKTDSTGDTMWTKLYGGAGSDKGKCVQQTKVGGYIILGFANIEGDIWPAGDIWLLKTDSEGDTIWTRIYRGYNFPYGGWVEQTSDGGYVFTSNWDMAYLLLLKADKDGNTEWSKNYQWGSEQIETGYCVRQTKDGGYIVATNLGLFKTDDKGDSMWIKPWAGHFVELTSDGGYFVLTGQNNDMWLIKTDEQGDTLWTKTYGGGDADAARSAQQTLDGGYIIVGETRSFGAGNYDVWLLKTDANGDTLWTRTYGWERVDQAYSVQQTTDGGYVLTGNTTMFSGDWRPDVLLIKTDSLGYVGVEEPVTHQLDWQVTPIGSQIVLQYENHPQSFQAKIYDASGRRVDEIRSQGESGTITWGEGQRPGVYFIRPISSSLATARKVVLVK